MYEVIDLILKTLIVVGLFRLSKSVRSHYFDLDAPLDTTQPYDYTKHDRDRPRSHLYDANKDPRLPG